MLEYTSRLFSKASTYILHLPALCCKLSDLLSFHRDPYAHASPGLSECERAETL